MSYIFIECQQIALDVFKAAKGCDILALDVGFPQGNQVCIHGVDTFAINPIEHTTRGSRRVVSSSA